MLPELHEIRERRKQLNLTQSQLSELSKISQSIIAKTENGAVVPSYENAKKLFDCLEQVSEQHGISAQHLMKTRIQALFSSDSVQKAIRAMQKNGFSQLPVLENGKIVGSVSEKGLLQKIEQGLSLKSAQQTLLSEVLEEAPPQIQANTPFKAVAGILEHSPLVLVSEKGKIKGIITKSDLLKSALDKQITKHSRLV